MTETEYIDQRLDDQIIWYENKSKFCKIWNTRIQVSEVLFAAIIPFIAGLGEAVPFGLIIIGILGVLIALCVGVSSVNKFQENWIVYRATAEMLKHEKYMFLTKSEPYTNELEFTLLVSRVEGIISKENSQWSTHIKKEKT